MVANLTEYLTSDKYATPEEAQIAYLNARGGDEGPAKVGGFNFNLPSVTIGDNTVTVGDNTVNTPDGPSLPPPEVSLPPPEVTVPLPQAPNIPVQTPNIPVQIPSAPQINYPDWMNGSEGAPGVNLPNIPDVNIPGIEIPNVNLPIQPGYNVDLGPGGSFDWDFLNPAGSGWSPPSVGDFVGKEWNSLANWGVAAYSALSNHFAGVQRGENVRAKQQEVETFFGDDYSSLTSSMDSKIQSIENQMIQDYISEHPEVVSVSDSGQRSINLVGTPLEDKIGGSANVAKNFLEHIYDKGNELEGYFNPKAEMDRYNDQVRIKRKQFGGDRIKAEEYVESTWGNMFDYLLDTIGIAEKAKQNAPTNGDGPGFSTNPVQQGKATYGRDADGRQTYTYGG